MANPIFLLALALAGACPAAEPPPAPPVQHGSDNVSGGPLRPEQAAYDVLHYDLRLRVHPEARTIRGTLGMRARLVAATDEILLDLDDALAVREVTAGERPLDFRRADGELRVLAPELFRETGVGGEFELEVAYGGAPRVAERPPWDGGFSWEETADGSPWIATSCQGEGADLWWPCKDHPSDEPDSMDLAITVPAPLVVASNGRLVGMDEADGLRTWRWHVSTPINNYGVALNIAPYETISRDYQSVAGEVFPVTYWVLPEHLEQGRALFEDVLRQLRFAEGKFGPYPFRADKYGVAETPFLGMEHQTIIAYGADYQGNVWGPKEFEFDALHLHEMAHEWWGNLVTARSWEDMWIHEGIGTYIQPLFVEELYGPEAYRRQMAHYRARIANRAPTAPRRTMNSNEIYFGQTGDSPGGDIYDKGCWVVHTLRWLLGDETFFRVLRRMAYPDPALERTTDGSACRFETTDGLLAVAEQASGRELGWFFELYLRQPELPELEAEEDGDTLRLTWHTPDDMPFPMPVPVRVGDELVRVAMEDGTGSLALEGRAWEVDPEDRILTKER